MGMPQKLINKFLEIFDGLTGYVVQLSSDHAYVHKGRGFVVPGITGSLSAGATYKIAFTTPTVTSGRYIHWRPTAVGGLSTGVSAELFEGSSSITGGATLTPLNMNRNIAVSSNMQSFLGGVTVGAEGTLIQVLGAGSAGSGSANVGGVGGAQAERVLIPNTTYSLTITNRSGSTASLVTYEMFFYEEDGYQG